MTTAQTQALAIAPSAGADVGVELVRHPDVILEQASMAATALMRVIAAKPKKLIFNGEQYLEVDDWETIGAFHGCTADIEWTRSVVFEGPDGPIVGWEARAVLLDRTGRILSHAEAMCLSDEEKWSDRPKYAWCYLTKDGTLEEDDPGPDRIIWEDNPDKPNGDGTYRKRPRKERHKVGMEKIPQFQLRSMAQTRAIAKVHGNVFRWVASLGGFKGTPAEELPVESVDNKPAPKTVSSQTSQAAPSQPAQTKPAVAKPATQAKPATVAAPAGDIRAKVADLKITEGNTNGKNWTLYGVKFDRQVATTNGKTADRASTFDEKAALAAEDAKVRGDWVEVKIAPGNRAGTWNLVALEVVKVVEHVTPAELDDIDDALATWSGDEPASA